MYKKIFFIIGEKSGENIARQVIDELNKKHQNLQIYGIFNPELMKNRKNMHMIFPSSEISVMGLVEVIKQLPKLIKKIKLTIKSILEIEPDMVISIDSYDFCIRVASKIRNKNKKIKLCHIVAPSVWAYKESRAKVISKYYDMLFCILPFETRFFERYGLKTIFIGNPALQSIRFDSNFKQQHTVGITLGSRISEIENHFSIIYKVICNLNAHDKSLTFYIFTTPETKDFVLKKLNSQSNYKTIKEQIFIFDTKIEKEKNMPKCKFAIAKSGTNTLEWTLAGVAIVAYYKPSYLTYIIAKLIVKAKYASLMNLILDQEVIPEFVKEIPNSENITELTIKYLENEELRLKQIERLQIAINKLKNPHNINPATDIVHHL